MVLDGCLGRFLSDFEGGFLGILDGCFLFGFFGKRNVRGKQKER